MHGQALVRRDADRAAEAVEGEALGEIGGGLTLAIDQHIVPVRPEDEVEQGLALRREEAGPKRAIGGEARDVVGDEPLEEAAHVLAREADERAVDEGGSGHEEQLGSAPSKSKLVRAERSRGARHQRRDYAPRLRSGRTAYSKWQQAGR